mmetsp:Transcript_36420/g.110121  ORF Transcript_36420/g.110121 Transcript_36420/m.110121 type:complete len:296 (+) Transcript_36420:82-969(+)
MAAALLELHGVLLRSVAASLGTHCQGLTQAAKLATRTGLLDSKTARKLMNLDTCCNVLRHYTHPYGVSLQTEIERQLAAGASAADMAHEAEAQVDCDMSARVCCASVPAAQGPAKGTEPDYIPHSDGVVIKPCVTGLPGDVSLSCVSSSCASVNAITSGTDHGQKGDFLEGEYQQVEHQKDGHRTGCVPGGERQECGAFFGPPVLRGCRTLRRHFSVHEDMRAIAEKPVVQENSPEMLLAEVCELRRELQEVWREHRRVQIALQEVPGAIQTAISSEIAGAVAAASVDVVKSFGM